MEEQDRQEDDAVLDDADEETTETATSPDPDLEGLLVYLRERRGFDFTGYKRPSLSRRIRRRMTEVGVASFSEYQDFLEVHPAEFTPLFNTILINVTSFFRDTAAWGHLRDDLLPELLAGAGFTDIDISCYDVRNLRCYCRRASR